MAIARVFDADGWTPEQYDTLIARMDLGGHSAPGVLYHWAARDAGRACGPSMSTRAARRPTAWRRRQIGPLVQELGLPMPAISEFEVRATLQP